jgi:DNA polymerase III delta subunit
MLKLALKDCLNTDFAIKTGAVKDDLAVEMLIISHSS